jgi:tetratricopeptide (TPR) repeat protein
MKKLIRTLFITSLVTGFITLTSNAQEIIWTSKSKDAKEWAKKGFVHYQNLENEVAYEDFTKALDKDPNFTMVQFMMSRLSVGDTRKMYSDQAKNSVANKSEAEKMIITLVDAKSLDEAHGIWTSLHNKFPGDAMSYYYYIITMSDTTKVFDALTEYLQKYPSNPEGINNIAYLYLLDKKDTATAKKYFEKYIEVYPDGYNPYDSMGEFYYRIGDMANSKIYYTKSLEHYPFCYTSKQKLEELNKTK